MLRGGRDPPYNGTPHKFHTSHLHIKHITLAHPYAIALVTFTVAFLQLLMSHAVAHQWMRPVQLPRLLQLLPGSHTCCPFGLGSCVPEQYRRWMRQDTDS